MIYPTARAGLLAGSGAIVALGIILIAPGFWAAGLMWIALILGAIVADSWLSPWPSDISIKLSTPTILQVGRSETISASISTDNKKLDCESRLETNALIKVIPTKNSHHYKLTPIRRGEAEIKKLWVRWRGPFGLIYKQHQEAIEKDVLIASDTHLIEKDAISVLTRENLFGEKIQIDKREGSEFDSLREFQSGMDTRSIDWKQSARHRTLLNREFRTEKNNSIVFAIDTGRLMSEPVANDLSKLDHALNASLLMSFVSLKLGDRVGLFAFDAKPQLTTGLVSGPRAFTLLQQLTAKIDYTHEETNFTLGLAELSAKLDRRTLIIIFTDFADSTSAELMLTNLAPLLKRHLVLFVAFRDDELEELINREPESPEDITRAVIADTLLRERDLVITKLQRMGALIVDSPTDRIGTNLINQYLKIKHRNLL